MTGEIFQYFSTEGVWALNIDDFNSGLTLHIQWTETFHTNGYPFAKEYYKNPGYFINRYEGVTYAQYPLLDALYEIDFDRFYNNLENFHLLGFNLDDFRTLGFPRRGEKELTEQKYRNHLRTKLLINLKTGLIPPETGGLTV
ncbi:hypothetical protein [Parapedobacter sp. 10938]|uniref:hypothetical protein n=1 Tax=Parapedobacter flavus TaxID=3110225 RepID=UPI002DB741C4|nr:hypothetical protein [Parapedobacter sp. 10938]MEC3882045.1 hypothetical protein [Parapedobacter sp. 10938]